MENEWGRDRAVSRRDLLRRSGMALAGGVAWSLLGDARTADAAGFEPKLILGNGSHRFECHHDWLTPPENLKWGDTQGVAQDAKENIYISHTVGADSPSKDAIVVFDKKGKFVKSFGARFQGGGHGLDIRKEGKVEYLYHCDTKNRVVVKTDLDGNAIWEKNNADVIADTGVYKAGMPFVPTNVALSPNGDVYITDGYGSDWITQYDINGRFVRVFGGRGAEPGKVSNAHGIWVDTRGKEPFVVVADRANHRLQYFTMDGTHVRFVDNGMRKPCHFDVRGDELLVPDLDSVVTVLDKDNKVAVQLGDGAGIPDLRGKPKSEFIPGKFIHPHSAKFLKNGDILVVEWVPQGRVTLLKKV